MSSSKRKPRSTGVRGPTLDAPLLALMRLVDAARYPEVEAAARRLLSVRPAQPLALKALGFALIGQGRYEEALPAVALTLDRSPDDPEAHNNMGIVLSALMRWEDSIQCFARSLELKPRDPEVLKNYGVALSRMCKYDEAVPFFLKAIEYHPGDYLDAIEQLANTLLNANRNDEAWTCFNELWKNDGANAALLSQLLCASLKRCDWTDLAARLETLRRLSSDYRLLADNPFVVLSFPGVRPDEHLAVASNYARHSIPSTVLDALPGEVLPGSTRSCGSRLRIGYLSADFRNHPVGLILPQVVELHDRARVQVFGYSMGVDDQSDIRRRLVGAFDRFVDVQPCGVAETAQRIRADQVDILVDLHGWTAYGRPEALALRCAPVQVNWLGYAGSTGHAKLADYLLGDPVVTPAGDRHYYTETLAHLPNCYLPADTSLLLSAPPPRRTAGLPEDAFVFCSFNNSYKFNPWVFDLWCRLLRENTAACLWMSQPSGSAPESLRKEMHLRGVDPSRLIFAPRVESRVEHLSRLQLADLALDPFPYNSHSSGVDVLWAGVPMVALHGDTFPGRVGASLLRAAGLDELIAYTTEEYYQISSRLLREPGYLHALRTRLVDNKPRCALFDMPRFVGGLEDVYFRMWTDHLRGVREPLCYEAPSAMAWAGV